MLFHNPDSSHYKKFKVLFPNFFELSKLLFHPKTTWCVDCCFVYVWFLFVHVKTWWVWVNKNIFQPNSSARRTIYDNFILCLVISLRSRNDHFLLKLFIIFQKVPEVPLDFELFSFQHGFSCITKFTTLICTFPDCGKVLLPVGVSQNRASYKIYSFFQPIFHWVKRAKLFLFAYQRLLLFFVLSTNPQFRSIIVSLQEILSQWFHKHNDGQNQLFICYGDFILVNQPF